MTCAKWNKGEENIPGNTKENLEVTEMTDFGEPLADGLCLAKAALKGRRTIIAISAVCTQGNPKFI